MKRWLDERGSMYLVEGTVLFPITFMALFLLLFFTLILFLQVDQEGKIRRALTQPTTSTAFVHPQESPQAKALLSSSRWSGTGLFFAKQRVQQQEEQNHSPFRFFSLSALEVEQERDSVWSSSATNLWRYQAVNGFCAKQAQKEGGT